MALYQNQFSEEHDFQRTDKPAKVLIVASTGRSGSHMLGHALYATGCFGFPLEYANPANFAEWQRLLGKESIQDVLQEIQQRRTSSNGVFGIKLHYTQIEMFGGFKEVRKIFPDAYYVLLSRKDVLKQAVSLAIARQTGVWITGQKSKCDNPIYNYNEIKACLRNTITHSASWRYTLAANGCNFIEMNFDAIKTDLPSAISQIADFMQIDVPSEQLPTVSVTKQQSNQLNDQWLQQFLNDHQDDELFNKPLKSTSVSSRIRRVLTKLKS